MNIILCLAVAVLLTDTNEVNADSTLRKLIVKMDFLRNYAYTKRLLEEFWFEFQSQLAIVLDRYL